MITSIARQSVVIKCNMGKASLLGNYEFYYAAGLFCKLSGAAVGEELAPAELKEAVAGELPAFSPSDEKAAYLAKLLAEYKPEERYDDQMWELFCMGRDEQHVWSVNGA